MKSFGFSPKSTINWTPLEQDAASENLHAGSAIAEYENQLLPFSDAVILRSKTTRNLASGFGLAKRFFASYGGSEMTQMGQGNSFELSLFSSGVPPLQGH